MAQAGRPPKPIDWEKLDKLVMCGCTGMECAAYFDMHHDNLFDKIKEKYGKLFTEFAAERHSKGKGLLREAQFDKAMDKDNTMMIWLGKQWLDQTEKKEISHSTASYEAIQGLSKDPVNDKT